MWLITCQEHKYLNSVAEDANTRTAGLLVSFYSRNSIDFAINRIKLYEGVINSAQTGPHRTEYMITSVYQLDGNYRIGNFSQLKAIYLDDPDLFKGFN